MILIITSLALEKWKKECNMLLFWYKIFVHCKSKLLNVLVDSILNSKQLYILIWCMVWRPGIEPGPHWREASALTTLPPLLRIYTTEYKPGYFSWKATWLKSRLESTIDSSLNAKTAMFILFCRSPWFSSGLSVLHTKCTALWSNQHLTYHQPCRPLCTTSSSNPNCLCK